MFKRASQLNDAKACLFTSHADLVWFSPAWGSDARRSDSEQNMIGARWHEYIAPDDHEYVLQWITGEGRGEPCAFRLMSPTGRWFCCVWTKRKWRGLWLVAGDVLEVAGVPAPPMPLLDHPEECECESNCACGGGQVMGSA